MDEKAWVLRQHKHCITASASWRDEAKKAHDYYHSDQYSAAELRILKERNQAPSVFNLLSPIVNVLAGQEVLSRTDVCYKGVEASDDETAEVFTNVYRQMGNDNEWDFEQSDSIREAVIGGLGSYEVLWDPNSKTVKQEYIPWEECWVDSAARRRDCKDARFIFRQITADKHELLIKFPEHKEAIEKLVADMTASMEEYSINKDSSAPDYPHGWETNADSDRFWYDPDSEVLTVVEFQFRSGDTKKKSDYTGAGTKKCIFVRGQFLLPPTETEYDHAEFSFIPAFCSMNPRNRHRYGIVKNLISPQDTLNRGISKAIFSSSTNRVLAEEGAVQNVSKLKAEISKPDCVITDFATGSLRDGRVKIERDTQATMDNQNLANTALSYMHRISGVNPELVGSSSNARSGTAIAQRINSGNTVLADIHDCIRKFKSRIAKRTGQIMAQFMKDEVRSRYTDPATAASVDVTLNEKVSIMNPETGKMEEYVERNLKDLFKYDVVVSDTVDADNARDVQLSQITELIKGNQALATPAVLSELVMSTNLRNKNQLAKAFQATPQEVGMQ